MWADEDRIVYCIIDFGRDKIAVFGFPKKFSGI